MNDNHILMLTKLLTNHYIEDTDGLFRLLYTPDFLRWALGPPGYFSKWHLGLVSQRNPKELLGFIAAIPQTFVVREL